MNEGLVRVGIVIASLCLFGCGKELGRVPFAAAGAGEASAALKAGDVAFWTDIDIEYEGNASLAYTIDLVQNGAVAASAVCNPLGRLPAKTGWIETNIGSSHSRRGNGKMDCSATVPSGGPTIVRAKLAFGQSPQALKLTRADLVVRQ